MRLRIALDTELTKLYGPEIHWTWRTILATIGIFWDQVAPTELCDLAFVRNPEDTPQASFCIRAEPAKWANAACWRFRALKCADTALALPVYDQDTADAAISYTAGRWVCQRDIVFDLFWLATGQEERYWPKNQHGFCDLSATPVLRHKLLQQALGSAIIHWLETRLALLGFAPTFPRWPAGRVAAACIGHDVDYPEVIRWLEPLRILRRRGLTSLGLAWQVLTGKRHHWHFDGWAALEKQWQTRSAFYFVARRGSLLQYAAGVPDPFYDITTSRFLDLFTWLRNEGFEIGMQASYLAYTSRVQLAAEKQKIEELCGAPVLGNRHHYWHLNPQDPEETLSLHEQVGLLYDTSLFHDRYVGWRRGLLHPFFPFHPHKRRELTTLQIPTGWMDDQLFGQQADNPGDRRELLRALADRVVANGGCLMVDVHDYVFDDQLFPGWAQTQRELWEYLVARGDFWLATPAHVAQAWKVRYTQLVQASRGLEQGLP